MTAITTAHQHSHLARRSCLRRLPAAGAVALVLCLALAHPVPALAQMAPVPANVVSLSSSASVEVVNDWINVVLSTTREGSDANAVQAQLRQALDVALAEARKAARPGQVELQTGSFSLFPRYAPPTQRAGATVPGGISGWQGTAELIVQGRDVQAITQLVGRINTLTVARLGFSLSREARDKVEATVTAQAIERFRERASAVTRAFGMGSYSLREVQVSGDEPAQSPRPFMRAQAGMAMAEAAQPVEAGNALVTISVSGSVQLLK